MPSSILRLIDHRSSCDSSSNSVRDYPLLPEVFTIPIAIKRRGAETRLIVSTGANADALPDPALIHLIGRAHLSRKAQRNGRSILTEVANYCQTDLSGISRILPCWPHRLRNPSS